MVAIGLSVFCNQNLEKVALSFCTFSSSEFLNNASEKLTSNEYSFFSGFSSVVRAKSFLCGRIAAKEALTLLDECAAKRDITKSENGQPVVMDSSFDVSISHSKDIAVAVAYPKYLSFGVDIEFINPKHEQALKRMSPRAASIKEATALWTIKEALSKALGTGVILDLETYDEMDLQATDDVYSCSFRNFSDYSGIALCNSKLALGIVFPAFCVIPISVLKDFFRENFQ